MNGFQQGRLSADLIGRNSLITQTLGGSVLCERFMQSGLDDKSLKPPRTFDIWLIAMIAAVGLFAGYGVLTVAQVA